MHSRLTITLFADETGPHHELWHALFTYRGDDLWMSLEAGWVGDAELEVTRMLARVPHVQGNPQRLRWSLARGATNPLQGQMAEVEVDEDFSLASIGGDPDRAAA